MLFDSSHNGELAGIRSETVMFGVRDDEILVLWFNSNENMAIKSYSEQKVQIKKNP